MHGELDGQQVAETLHGGLQLVYGSPWPWQEPAEDSTHAIKESVVPLVHGEQ
jgi:hypothetical protein